MNKKSNEKIIEAGISQEKISAEFRLFNCWLKFARNITMQQNRRWRLKTLDFTAFVAYKIVINNAHEDQVNLNG